MYVLNPHVPQLHEYMSASPLIKAGFHSSVSTVIRHNINHKLLNQYLSNRLKANSYLHGARSTDEKLNSEFILARSTEQATRGTEHGARSTEHGARSTEHG